MNRSHAGVCRVAVGIGLLRFVLLLLAGSPMFGQVMTYRVRALIDGSSVLFVQGTGIYWHNLSYYAPGRYVEPGGTVHNDATVLTTTSGGAYFHNGYNWYPNWPSGDFGDTYSSPIQSFALPSSDMTVDLKVISGRGGVSIYQMPNSTNAYRLGVLFNDNNIAGADWYEAEISINATVPPADAPKWNKAFSQNDLTRISMNMAYDSGRQVTVMFGGRDGLLIPMSDTYEYASYAWTRVPTLHSPSARFWSAMAYDENRRRMVLFGGTADNQVNLNDTWEYDGSDWRAIPTPHSPPAQNGASLTYDSCRHRIVLFTTTRETWEYDGVDWVRVITGNSPPNRTLSPMVFDPQRCQTILFGGGAFPALADTWEYDGVNWTEKHPATSPSGRWAHNMVFDTVRRRAVLFGGYGPLYPSGQPTNDTWEYDGTTWTQVYPVDSPGNREQHGMAYDPIRRGAVMFGGFGGGGDSWEYSTLPPCSYSLNSPGFSTGSDGGMSSFGVTTDATCSWKATASVDWITILPGGWRGPGQVNFTVAANRGAARSGSVSVGGKQYNVNQDGFSCSFQVNPLFAAFNNSGGDLRVTVTAPSGCPWTASSSTAWLSVKSGASGNGSGAVVLNAQANPGAPRSGPAIIAGATFSASQGAGACGALDVTSQMGVIRSGLSWIYPSRYMYSSGITVVNNSGAVMRGPVYVVMLGLPTASSGLLGNQRITTCFSPGDYLILASGSDMAPGQSIGIPVIFYVNGPFGSLQYSTKVLSGTPSK